MTYVEHVSVYIRGKGLYAADAKAPPRDAASGPRTAARHLSTLAQTLYIRGPGTQPTNSRGSPIGQHEPPERSYDGNHARSRQSKVRPDPPAWSIRTQNLAVLNAAPSSSNSSGTLQNSALNMSKAWTHQHAERLSQRRQACRCSASIILTCLMQPLSGTLWQLCQRAPQSPVPSAIPAQRSVVAGIQTAP